MSPLKTLLAALTLLAATVAAAPAGAQGNPTPTEAKAVDAKAFKPQEPGLYANADLSYVLTSGNASSSSLGFKGDVTRRWTKHSLSFALGGIRSSSSPSDSRYALGTPDDYEVFQPDAEPTAEYYYARGRYDYKLTERFFVTGGAGWERNRFSGIDDRWLVDAGAGYTFLSNEKTDLRGMAALTFTDEKYTYGPPDSDSFVGLRAGWDLRHQLLPTTTLLHTLVLDENLEETDDLRVDFTLGIQVAMSSRLALKASYRLLFDNLPALAEVPLLDLDDPASGLPSLLLPYEKTDHGLSVSLVFSIAPPKKK